MTEGKVSQNHARGRPGHELPEKSPLRVCSIGQNGDEIAEYQQRQNQAARLLAAGKHMGKKRNRQNAQAGNAGFRDADQDCA